MLNDDDVEDRYDDMMTILKMMMNASSFFSLYCSINFSSLVVSIHHVMDSKKSWCHPLLFYSNNIDLKASFDNVKSEMHGPTCNQCLWCGVTLKP